MRSIVLKEKLAENKSIYIFILNQHAVLNESESLNVDILSASLLSDFKVNIPPRKGER